MKLTTGTIIQCRSILFPPYSCRNHLNPLFLDLEPNFGTLNSQDTSYHVTWVVYLVFSHFGALPCSQITWRVQSSAELVNRQKQTKQHNVPESYYTQETQSDA